MGDPPDAGGERGNLVADEHALREARLLLRGVGERQGHVGAGEREGRGLPANAGELSGSTAKEYGCEFGHATSGVRDRQD
jgi:hypothetical protein